jgi:hypothetical protein
LVFFLIGTLRITDEGRFLSLFFTLKKAALTQLEDERKLRMQKPCAGDYP